MPSDDIILLAVENALSEDVLVAGIDASAENTSYSIGNEPQRCIQNSIRSSQSATESLRYRFISPAKKNLINSY